MMFYTQLFTSKRGPLAKIWLAAHWERKLTRAHVFECNLEATIRDIISPKMKIGLRTSGHLLIGVVRIYSRKAKYLLADCNDALVKIKIAFRPAQTDMPVESLEATVKAITLIEDFTSFDAQLSDPSNIDVVDHFSLNQSRSEEITLKEDFGSGFLNLVDFGDESQSHRSGLLDVSLQSVTQHADTFGDEDKGIDLLDFLTNFNDHAEFTEFIPEEPQKENPEISAINYQQDSIGFPDADRMEVETPTLSETTLLANEEEAFALEPVAITPNSEKKKGKRKRKLLVDQTKELSDESIREQLSDYSDLIAPFDMAPPTLQLMQWKESGGADKLFAQPCSTVVAPQMRELFAKTVFQVKYDPCEEVEMMRQDGQEVQRDISALTTSISVPDSSVDPERTHNTELTVLDHMNDSQHENYSKLTQDENKSEFTHPELPSEDSMFVRPSLMEQNSQTTSHHTQSMLDSQDFENRRITKLAQELLNTMKSNNDTTFSLEALCEGGTRSQAATTFFCLLVLKNQRALDLHQHAPYEDIFATPGPNFGD